MEENLPCGVSFNNPQGKGEGDEIVKSRHSRAGENPEPTRMVGDE
jgi:hypothetical protein